MISDYVKFAADFLRILVNQEIIKFKKKVAIVCPRHFIKIPRVSRVILVSSRAARKYVDEFATVFILIVTVLKTLKIMFVVIKTANRI